MMSDDKTETTEFLNRWSRKKAEARTATVAEDEAAAGAVDAEALPEQPVAALDPEALPGEESDANADGDTVTESEEIPPEIADIDIDAMDYNSDFTVFMKDNVPEVVRRRALRQLWRSNPVLANVDGLNDYDEDFTDAALVVKGLKSAYQIGKGYLTDEDEDVEDAESAETAETTAESADVESADAETAETAATDDDTASVDTQEAADAGDEPEASNDGDAETPSDMADDVTLDTPVKEV